MRPPTALTIAGTDPSGGAGIQADLKTFTALGTYGTSAITAVVAQNTTGVQDVHYLPGAFVDAQITSVIDDIPLDATKIGMLGTAEIATSVADALSARRRDFGRIVLDPVMVATSGDPLISGEAARIVRERLVPMADVLTPNLMEAAQLLGEDAATDVDSMRDQALRLQKLGVSVVVLKGGHVQGDQLVDVVVHPGGTDLLRADRINTRNTHGTGCTLSSAIAAQYARIADFDRNGDLGEIGKRGSGDDDFTIVASAREFLAGALERAVDWTLSKNPSKSHGPVNHLITLDEA
ncbi:MAG: bifunctional hydroxymethylpyrimidine kinase/phosphomethylpyrimidine kinase [Brachybacterium sp.]|nr:bifunctional hydroxymethylpyrimidine kinase/phosphomethylpyrimidine kinase [Brachybacterium sp.]